MGGFAHLATLVKRLRARSPGALLLDGGDTWQGSATALWTRGQDMVVAAKLLGVNLNTDWSRYAGIPAFDPANRINAYGTYLLMEKESLGSEHSNPSATESVLSDGARTPPRGSREQGAASIYSRPTIDVAHDDSATQPNSHPGGMIMRTSLLAAIAVLVLAVTGASAWADEVPRPLKHAKAGDLGTVVTGPTGMTLYTFANDKEPGKSACDGGCADRWPPFRPDPKAAAPKAPLSIITRADGSTQYAWKGKPLYYFKNDKKPGDTIGHKVGDVWFVAQP